MHGRSPLKEGQFVKVNCAAIPGSLLESELFGYEKGAFTGAHASKPGRVELAEKGTLFLDEIADLDMGYKANCFSSFKMERSHGLAGNLKTLLRFEFCAPPIATWRGRSRLAGSGPTCTTG